MTDQRLQLERTGANDAQTADFAALSQHVNHIRLQAAIDNLTGSKESAGSDHAASQAAGVSTGTWDRVEATTAEGIKDFVPGLKHAVLDHGSAMLENAIISGAIGFGGKVILSETGALGRIASIGMGAYFALSTLEPVVSAYKTGIETGDTNLAGRQLGDAMGGAVANLPVAVGSYWAGSKLGSSVMGLESMRGLAAWKESKLAPINETLSRVFARSKPSLTGVEHVTESTVGKETPGAAELGIGHDQTNAATRQAITTVEPISTQASIAPGEPLPTERTIATADSPPANRAEAAGEKSPPLVAETASEKAPAADLNWLQEQLALRLKRTLSQADRNAPLPETKPSQLQTFLGRIKNQKLIAATGEIDAAPVPAAAPPGFEVVLSASGAETTAHIGFLQALEDKHVPVTSIIGASGGSLAATFYANGYSAAQMKTIFLSPEFRIPSPSVLADCMHLMDPWNLWPYALDMKPWLQDVVTRYKLKPQPGLRIVAADSITHEPTVFQGTNYDLVEALTASTAATPAMGLKPVRYNGRTLVDGFYFHPIPAALAETPPAIVSKIGFTTQPPSEVLSPWDFFMHIKEMLSSAEQARLYPDPPGHIIAETGIRSVAMTTFGISTQTMQRLIDHAYQATTERLEQPDAATAIENRLGAGNTASTAAGPVEARPSSAAGAVSKPAAQSVHE